MRTIVISQPYYFPWRGFIELRTIPDVFVYLDDIQFPRGRTLMSRVQLKTKNGFEWITVPVKRNSETLIKDVLIDNTQGWQNRQISLFKMNYKDSLFYTEALNLMLNVLNNSKDSLCELCIQSTEQVYGYLGFKNNYLITSDFNIPKSSNKSQKMIDLIKYFDSDTIITGMGALNYYDFELFEKNNIRVEFIKYENTPYNQLFGNFNPYVTSLDLISHCGKESRKYLTSKTIYWKDFINSNEAKIYLNH